MGMYDTVFFVCPDCNEETVDIQTKDGDCCLDSFYQHAVPAHLAHGLAGSIGDCSNCGKSWEVRPVRLPTVMMSLRRVKDVSS